MRGSVGHVLAVCAALWGTASAACSANLLIDDYSTYSTNVNDQGGWTSDDGSMTSITANVAAKKLTFTPKAGSYFYTSFGSCVAATTQGYNAITFPFKGPSAGSSFILELQTASSCASTTYNSYTFTVSGLTGATQTITVPLSSFAGANLNVIKAIVFGDYSKTGSAYELGQMDFSRLTFMYYNALLQPTSDDATMTSVVVIPGNRVVFTPKAGAYFYSNLDCVSATNKWGGIGLRIKAQAGTTFTVQLQYSASCSTDNFLYVDRTTAQLGWVFDGTEKFYSLPFSLYSGLDTGKLMSIMLHSTNNRPITLGPMAMYCGNTASEYVVAPTPIDNIPSATVPVTSSTATAFVIDQFSNPDSNALGFWHGGDDPTGYTISGGKLTIRFTDSDYAFYSQISAGCRDLTAYNNGYLHIAYSGSTAFSIALQQHNSACNENIAPYPETWDEVEASRYATAADIYVPISHFGIVKARAVGFAFKGFTSTTSTVITKVEIVGTVPAGRNIASKLPTAPLVFACTRPNSLAFAIDDGSPEYAQEVMKIIREENIKVTFFTVGVALRDSSNNLTNVYKDMLNQGHQVAYHSYTHPKIEGLGTNEAIDWEITQDIDAMTQTLGITSTHFRPPFGNEGAKMRQRIAKLIPGGKLINWSIDCEDWLYATGPTPEKQLDAFKRDLAKGGNLVVMHYLYPSTVSYLRQFIQLAKASGKQLMRVDQCLQEPGAPPV
ncbi:hypothetical protein Q9L58_008041 [Maublancomyces gigas]|uniref:NodB homology domain-containing protein n=1 Tax=Discina gigas TaxID=1032678 RepID=A0ABR3GBD6_9PEZI